ncbi:MAG TPA: FG-GAP repeat protein, partial [Haliangium sp.]|nr:FG-GAP repeat protein [Haliangium sp.]
MIRWPIALALLVAGCGGSTPPPPPAEPDAGVDRPDASIDPTVDGGQPPDAIDPNRPDAGPPVGFDFPTPITASDGASLNWFGYSVAADENVIVVGAPFYDLVVGDQITDPSIGAAYVFERIGDSWQQTALLLSNASVRTSILFGWSVAVDGNLIAVGAWNEDIPGDQFGAVYVFERVGGAWTQNAKLLPLSGDDQERFGHSVAVSGSRIAVGAPFISDVDDSERATPAYVFERNGTNWLGTRLQPTDDPRDSWFGYSVALSGNVAVVGAPGDKKRGLGTGAAYVFENNGASWNQTARLEDAEG